VQFAVHLQGQLVVVPRAEEEESTATEEVSKDPGPIIPEGKELLWACGSFVVFALLIRFWIFPKLRKGMAARYDGIRSDHEQADAERAAARSEVADYEAQVATIRAEAARVVDDARAMVEGERQRALAELNERISAQRAAAAAEAEAARAAAQTHVREAVSDVAGRAGELATGRRPAPEVLDRVVQEVMAQ
jgi:F-type H+-transporting ATPase subunit b